MSEYFANLAATQKTIEAARAQLQKDAKNSLKPALMQFLNDNPKIDRVEWTQYTPYFNDGDTCTFIVHEPYFFLRGVEEGGDYDDGGETVYSSGYVRAIESTYGRDTALAFGEETYNACAKFASELSQFDEALEAVFGDHVKVIVTRDGVDTEEYSHD